MGAKKFQQLLRVGLRDDPIKRELILKLIGMGYIFRLRENLQNRYLIFFKIIFGIGFHYTQDGILWIRYH